MGRSLRFAPALLAITAALTVLLAVNGTGSRASAQEPVSVFFGYVDAAVGEPLPTSVRALVGNTVCGSADVLPLEQTRGFYLVDVVSASEKAGCGEAGDEVRFRLVTGEVGGVFAPQTGEWEADHQRIDLLAAVNGRFIGHLPRGPGVALLRWSGPSGVPVAEAVGTMGRDVQALYYWNAAEQEWLFYIPGALVNVSTYTIVDSDDIVFVRLG